MTESLSDELGVPTVASTGTLPPLNLNNRTQALVSLVRSSLGYAPVKVLVVGCGSGYEAAALALGLNAKVSGIDIREEFDPVAACHATLLRADAERLPVSNAFV